MKINKKKSNKKFVITAALMAAALATTVTACGKQESKGAETLKESAAGVQSANTPEPQSTNALEPQNANPPEPQSANPPEPQAASEPYETESGAKEEEASASAGLFGTFESVTLFGEEVNQDIFAEADLTMVNIWGTFCGPCIAEMPDLGELNREYKDKGFQVVGIISNVTEPDDGDALEIVEKTEADYTHILLSEDLYNNYLAVVTLVPTTIFVDKEGNQVGTTYAGSKSKAKWKAIIDEYLKKVQE